MRRRLRVEVFGEFFLFYEVGYTDAGGCLVVLVRSVCRLWDG